jgi:hypothetical protein
MAHNSLNAPDFGAIVTARNHVELSLKAVMVDSMGAFARNKEINAGFNRVSRA